MMLEHGDDLYFPEKRESRRLPWIISAAVAVSAILLLTGCGGQQLQPSPMPTIPQVMAQVALTGSIPPAAVHDFYTNGLTMVQMNCGGYFDQAVMNALSQAQTSGQISLLSGLASGIMGLAGVGGPATAGVGVGAAFLQNMILNQSQNSLAGTDPAGMSSLVNAAQQTLTQAILEPTTAADAWADIYAVYRACSPAGIQALKEQAINAAPSHLSIVGGPQPLRPGIQPSRHIIPSVRVN